MLHRMKLVFAFALLLLTTVGQAQITITEGYDTIRVMHFNLLNFPGTTGATRYPLLKRIVQYAKPEIFAINELGRDTSADRILQWVLNINGETRWRKVNKLSPTQQLDCKLFYRTDKFALKSVDTAYGAPRFTDGSRLYYLDSALGQPGIDTTWLNIWQAHLQSSTGSANEASRLRQCNNFVNRINNTVTDSNLIFCGDFNLYDAAEPAYQKLLSAGPFQLHDPINRPGAWSNNAAFADVHTQSPRTTQFGGGATGGLDDRFDFILTTKAMMTGSHRILNLTSTYKALGNDGQHFNQALTRLPNGSVPDSIALAIHDQSDHLPVIMDIRIRTRNQVVSLAGQLPTFKVNCSNPNPTHFSLDGLTSAATYTLLNQLGQVIAQGSLQPDQLTEQLPAKQNAGVYYLKVSNASHTVVRRLLWY